MTYKQFVEFVKKYEDKRSTTFKKRWFKLNLRTGVVYLCERNVGKNEYDWVWIYDGYFPIYKDGVLIGVGDYYGNVRSSIESSSPPLRMDDVGIEMVILTDVYGDLDGGD
jgi:hypothetical protein